MVTLRNPGETDAEYVARIGDDAFRRGHALAQADRATVYLTMSAALGRQGGFDAEGLDGWQRRSALVRGVEHGYEYAGGALDPAADMVVLGMGIIERLPADLRAAMQTLSRFTLQEYDTLRPIPQADIEAVSDAAATVAERLKPVIEALKGS